MSRISDDDIRRVREATDLVALASDRVVLRQKGRLFWGCCPFHDEKTPSFKIDPDMQLWHCFGCGKGGDVFGYVMESERLDFVDAVRMLADRANIDIHEQGGPSYPRSKKERLMLACEAAQEFFCHQLMRSKEKPAVEARAYLAGRGFGSAPSRSWHLGYAPGRGKLVEYLSSQGFTRDEMIAANLAFDKGGRAVDRFFERVMFPVCDVSGRTIAFGGRVIGAGEPKYLNTSETPIFHKSSNLFGIDRAKSAIVSAGKAVVVEGYTDVIALHEAGIKNAVATLGTALTAQHVKLLSRFATSIVYLFDGDAAGIKAADRASEFIDWQSAVESRRNPIDLRVAVLPGGTDPAEYVADKGADGILAVLDGAEPLLQFSINRCLDRFDLRRPESKARALREAVQILYPIKASVTATDYVNLIADRLNVEYTAVSKALSKTKAPVAARHNTEDDAVLSGNSQQAEPALAEITEEEQQSVMMERKLVALVVSDAKLLTSLGRELCRIAWQDAACEQMADALVGVDPASSPAQAFAAVTAACPQAPAVLASAIDDEESDEAERIFKARLLARSLRERDLKREVRLAKARMRTQGVGADELNELFEKTVAMQKELASLQNAALYKGE